MVARAQVHIDGHVRRMTKTFPMLVAMAMAMAMAMAIMRQRKRRTFFRGAEEASVALEWLRGSSQVLL